MVEKELTCDTVREHQPKEERQNIIKYLTIEQTLLRLLTINHHFARQEQR